MDDTQLEDSFTPKDTIQEEEEDSLIEEFDKGYFYAMIKPLSVVKWLV